LATAAFTVSAVAGGALPARADDNSIRDHGCTITAYDPIAHYAENTATAEGRIQCDNRANVTIVVHLQIMRAGDWVTTAKKGDAAKGVFGIDRSVTGGCARYPSYYRTKTVASINGNQSVSVATVNHFLVCPTSPAP
jgi:hypothetical protein